MSDVLDQAQRKRCMTAIRSSGTKPELALRQALWAAGLRYRVSEKLLGRPDIVFRGARIAVFVDGCFWHGCPQHGRAPSTNQSYWGPKLSRNIARDREVTQGLTGLGWIVVRIWEHEVQQDLANCVERVATMISRRRKCP